MNNQTYNIKQFQAKINGEPILTIAAVSVEDAKQIVLDILCRPEFDKVLEVWNSDAGTIEEIK